MSVYLDASLLVAFLSPERASAAVQDWVASQPRGSLRVSAWVGLEVASGLARKARTRDLTREQVAEALALYRGLTMRALISVPVDAENFAQAGGFVGDAGLGLRAGDAMHLAIAAGRGFSLATLDVRMAESGRALGIPTELVWREEMNA